ncbi:MAG: 50S ribosomal protein L32 [Planctomycetes bacterium]|nr:50S ribosomal protein L32 [Planctomycetota bacterium]
MVKGFKLTRLWKGNRNSNKKLQSKGVSPCSRCGQPKLPHTICGNCGHYKDKKVIDMTNL